MTLDSADGEVAEPVKQFLHSILETGDTNEMNFWAKEICKMGGSSGEDMLNGLAYGILFFCALRP